MLCTNKTEEDCLQRLNYLRAKKDEEVDDKDKLLVKGNWTEKEDEILRLKVEEHGLKKWKEIAEYLPGRIGK